MDMKEMRALTNAEVEKKIIEAKAELFNLKFQNATGKLENTARIGHVKRAIARMKTVLNERAE